jgi:hypothetical protein
MAHHAARSAGPIGRALALSVGSWALAACSSVVIEPILPPESPLDAGSGDAETRSDLDADAVRDEGRSAERRDAEATRGDCEESDWDWSDEEKMLAEELLAMRAHIPSNVCGDEDFPSRPLTPSLNLSCVAGLGVRHLAPPTDSHNIKLKQNFDTDDIMRREVQVGLTPGTIWEELHVFNAESAEQIARELRSSAKFACIVVGPRLRYVGIAQRGSSWVIGFAPARWGVLP